MQTPEELVERFKRQGLFDERRAALLSKFNESQQHGQLSQGVSEFVETQVRAQPELLGERTKALRSIDSKVKEALQKGELGAKETDEFIEQVLRESKVEIEATLRQLSKEQSPAVSKQNGS